MLKPLSKNILGARYGCCRKLCPHRSLTDDQKKKKKTVERSGEFHPNQVVKVITSHETYLGSLTPNISLKPEKETVLVVFLPQKTVHHLNLSMKKLSHKS